MFWLIGTAVGLALIAASAFLLVGSSKRVADRTGLEHYVFGISVLAVATVLPEVSEVLVTSDRAEMTDIVVGNGIGLVFLGIALMVFARLMDGDGSDIRRHVVVIGLAAVCLPLAGLLSYIGFAESLALVAAVQVLLFAVYLMRRSDERTALPRPETHGVTGKGLTLALAAFIIGMAAYGIGFELMSDGLLGMIDGVYDSISAAHAGRLTEVVFKGLTVSLGEIILASITAVGGERKMAVGMLLGCIFLNSIFSCLGVLYLPLTGYR